jgi:2-haloacid dehalogenase
VTAGGGTGPSVIVFDVNETLSDMSPMAGRFADVGAPEHLAKLWFASLLRDGFALTAAGTQERFAVLADGALRGVLTGVPLDRDLDAAVEHVLAGIAELAVHPDVPGGVRALRATGRRLVTLSNGSAGVAEQLLDGAGIRKEFERLLSVEDAGVWKPARGSYEYAAEECGTGLADMLLVASHPWDIDGAARAGMATAWIDRTGAPYPAYATAPTHRITALDELAGVLGG